MARKSKSLKLLFVTDPLKNFHPQRETTLFMMEEAHRRGHEVYACRPADLNAKHGSVFAHVEKIKILGIGKRRWYQNLLVEDADLGSFNAILLRQDPPFDSKYLNHLYLLDLKSQDVYMMNHPRGIMVANEKIFALRFPDLVPETLVSNQFSELNQFINKHPQGTILKPIHTSGGRGVFIIRNQRSDNVRVILESATHDFSQSIIAQSLVPEISEGDRRVLLCGTEILGAFVRKAASFEHRSNLHAGGSAHPTKITQADKKIVKRLAPKLKQLGLDFVGLDIIGDRLIEVNVTSPMGLAELAHTGYIQATSRVIDYLEKKIQGLSS